MNIWMAVIGKMEESAVQCQNDCGNECTDLSVHLWDTAVAFYVGSLAGESGTAKGNLMYDLADRMCKAFRTCGQASLGESGTSYVNIEAMSEFSRGQAFAAGRQCDELILSKERIVRLMTVPLVQATIRSAYFRGIHPAATEEDGEIDEAMGATYAATILPLVHACDPNDAEIIYTNMRLTPNVDLAVDFRAVKTALEHSYSCMGLTCKQVGGVWEKTQYGTSAAPCGGTNDEKNLAGIVVGTVFGGACICLLAFVLFHRNRKRTRNRIDDEESPIAQKSEEGEIRSFD